jgi:hypothetical protein
MKSGKKRVPARNQAPLETKYDVCKKIAKIHKVSQVNLKLMGVFDRLNTNLDIFARCINASKHFDCTEESELLKAAESSISKASQGFLLKFNSASMPKLQRRPGRGGK